MTKLSSFLRGPACLALLLIIIFFAGCGREKRYIDTLSYTPRADPAQMQWLERQSMLYASNELLKVVSGSNLQWMAEVADPEARNLFAHADAWLLVSPYELVTESRKRAFSQLSDAALWKILDASGIHGLYVSPVLVSGRAWNNPGLEDYNDGDDVVGFTFSDLAGDEESYFRLLRTANQNHGIVGMNIVPAATGLGPDFILACRNMRQYPGLYALIEVSKEFWDGLPENLSEWQASPLSAAQVARLSEANFLPAHLLQDDLLRNCGWAATGEVRGFDAQPRRFVYRYYQDSDQPVLNWTDPSSAARRVTSASIIQTVGKWGAALTGARLLPMAGLAPGRGFNAYSLEPALTAATDIGQETRRYGGWSWQQDRLPLEMLRSFQEKTALDFLTDSISALGAEHALLTGDAAYLNNCLRRAVAGGVDFSRLVHVLPGRDGVLYRSDLLPISGEDFPPTPPDSALPFMENGVLPLSGAGLAALALGINTANDLNPEQQRKIVDGHIALTWFLAMQPGLLMFPAQDLAGTVTPDWDSRFTAHQEFNSQNGVSLLEAARRVKISDAGIVQYPALYHSLEMQSLDEASYLSRVKELLKLRGELGVAEGVLYRAAEDLPPGVAAVFTALPDGTELLTVVNFARETRSAPIPLEKAYDKVEEVGKGAAATAFATRSGTLTLKLDPWACRTIRLYGGKTAD